jgi:site-specific recombinase XerD
VRGLAVATRRSYASDLSDFLDWLAVRGTALEALDRVAVRGFAAELGRRGYAPATLARKLSTVRSLCRFLSDRDVLAADPSQYLPGPRRRRRLPRALRAAELESLFAATAGADPASLRDRLAFELLYGCGLRSQELVDLDVGDVHLDRGDVIVRGKGGKMRVVPLGDEAAAAVQRYLESGRGAAGGRARGPPPPRQAAKP